MTNNIFLVTSAICNDYGVYSYKERLDQLLSTIRSIRKYSPDSEVRVYDASENLIPEQDAQILMREATTVYSLYDHPYVKHMIGQGLQDPNRMAKKTIGEIVCIMTFLHHLKNEGHSYDRVFKISGRFCLNENFNVIDYSNHAQNIVIKQRTSWYGDTVFYSRLWSFDFSLLDKVLTAFEDIHVDTMTEATNNNTVRVLEYNMFKFFMKHGLPIVEVPLIGLEGNFGQDGAYINE